MVKRKCSCLAVCVPGCDCQNTSSARLRNFYKRGGIEGLLPSCWLRGHDADDLTNLLRRRQSPAEGGSLSGTLSFFPNSNLESVPVSLPDERSARKRR